ncbi:MAG: bifunctional diaminohydroxyphosphoribosylaminopyrimidine deaminase/5-amino-6-(5-phosphoribosylamino)uracil reductase RibD [Deltaproteobacteria bacterium]|nr:bifunctional diaminohydroxyphosphoribosylaminopyrimidine deaminase/5-amino-6-(5-phosphoribosylamino)uracil reductase RibD [Deltaproteobacteria bacterium]
MAVPHERFMRVALVLARKGLGRTSPNPAVGAIVVKNGDIAGRGYHKKAGLPHAEIIALEEAGERAKGADLYVTLEPCVHFGRTPPCADAILRAGIKRVVIGAKDPNPKVNGKGMRRLEKAGVRVIKGILADKCRALNEAYGKHIKTGMPFVILKLASSLDGRISTAAGESKWITSLESRKYVHRLRSTVDCVMVGSGTVIKDDPRLTVRLVRGRNPARAVVDSGLKIPLDSIFFSGGSDFPLPSGERACPGLDPGVGVRGKIFVFTTVKASKKKIKLMEEKGAKVIIVPTAEGGVSLKRVLRELGRNGITSVMIEGGSRLAAGALKEGVVDRVVFFVAPLIIGGDGVPSIGDLGIKGVKKAFRIRDMKTKRVGGDIMVEGYVD